MKNLAKSSDISIRYKKAKNSATVQVVLVAAHITYYGEFKVKERMWNCVDHEPHSNLLNRKSSLKKYSCLVYHATWKMIF